MLTSSPWLFHMRFLVYKIIHSFITHYGPSSVCLAHSSPQDHTAKSLLSNGLGSSKKRWTKQPISKIVPAVINAIETENLGERSEGRGEGELSLDTNLTKKPAVRTGERTGERASGLGKSKSKGLEPQENRIINHSAKSVESDRQTGAIILFYWVGSHVSSAWPFSPQHPLSKHRESLRVNACAESECMHGK